MVTAERLDVAPVERNSVKSEIFLEGHRSAASIIVGLVLVLVLLRISVSVGIGVNLSGRGWPGGLRWSRSLDRSGNMNGGRGSVRGDDLLRGCRWSDCRVLRLGADCR